MVCRIDRDALNPPVSEKLRRFVEALSASVPAAKVGKGP